MYECFERIPDICSFRVVAKQKGMNVEGSRSDD